MRIWSLHPKYLDAKGLVALWRETLLAKHVLEGRTKGYKNHPQLLRFKNSKFPLDLINQYLSEVYHEAVHRKYAFDKTKIDWNFRKRKLSVTTGQLAYETKHLLKKLQDRDPKKFNELIVFDSLNPHPMFEGIPGEVEEWEVI